MRRRRQRYTFKFHFLIFIIIFFIVVSVSYAYLTTSLHISGIVQGIRSDNQYPLDPTSNPNLAFNMNLTNSWIEGNINKYQYRISLTNIGSVAFDNFQIIITFKSVIDAVQTWNYTYTIDKKIVTIINNTMSLASQATATIDFVVSVKSSNLVISLVKLNAITTVTQVGLDKFNVLFTKTGSWGNYTYQYDVKVTNKTGNKITYWQLDITLPQGTTYVYGWSGIFSSNNNILTIKSTASNGYLDNNASATFGLQLSTNIVNFIPTDIKIMVR